jgi:alkanesulfonate monooxygenase SsuD/methylene tetrahydromethanopterin reductase-like flavin-dependent oxidoreductase (luciferase family)
MRFGILSFAIAPYDDLARRFRQVEELGFASAWLDDDILTEYADFEPWTALAALARDTERIRLGTMVTAITYRHPSFLAAQVATLDAVSAGRAALGIGAGGPPNPYSAFGFDEWKPRERADRLEEQVAILDQLLRGENVDFDGRYYPVEGAQLPEMLLRRPRPALIVAAHGDRGLRLTARYADGWNSFGGQADPGAQDRSQPITLTEAVASTKRRSERLDAFCREVGRDPATLRCSVLAYHPVPDPLSSLDAFDEYVGAYAEIGIEEISYYWPPTVDAVARRAPSPQQQAMFERIATERVLAYTLHKSAAGSNLR